MSDIETLLERVKAATGPDQVLDCLIWCATAESNFEYYGPRIDGEGVIAVTGGFQAWLYWKDMPHYTASIDASLALVEKMLPGHGIAILRLAIDDVFKQLQGILDGPQDEWLTLLPLAILAALLTALQAQGKAT